MRRVQKQIILVLISLFESIVAKFVKCHTKYLDVADSNYGQDTLSLLPRIG